MNLRVISSLFSILLFSSVSFAQLGTNTLEVRINMNKTIIKRGETADAFVYLKNPTLDETIELKAVATYIYENSEYTAESNVVTLTVDNSINANVSVYLGNLTYVNDSARYDNVLVKPVLSNRNIVFNNLLVQGDGREHIITFSVRR